METLVESRAPVNTQQSGAAPKGDSVRGRPTTAVLLQDLIAALRAPGFWLYGAWIDTSVRYRSQALGAFWMVSGTLAFVAILGTLFSQVMHRAGSEGELYYAHIAVGYVLWLFMSQSIQQSARVFKKNKSMIENGYVKYVDYVLRQFTGQLINLCYNLSVVVGVILLTPVKLSFADLSLLIAIPLVLLAVLGGCFFISVIAARYSDIGEVLQSFLRLFFFLTPIIWVPSAVGKGGAIGAFIYANPFYYLIEIIRAPLVYSHIPWFEIGMVAAATPLIWLAASFVYARGKPYIALWI